MDLETHIPHAAKNFAVLAACLLTCTSCTSAQNSDDSWPVTVEIHGGAATGSYNSFVEVLLADRAEKLRTACEQGECEELPEECEKNPDECRRLSDFNFDVPKYVAVEGETCPSSGSLSNLRRLGMSEEDPNKKSIHDVCIKKSTEGDRRPEFGLVQNYFIYAAAAPDCDEEDSDDCKSQVSMDLLEGYQQFSDLRIVLPLFYGRIQLITTNTAKTVDGKHFIKTLADLKGTKVYLGTGVSVNKVYGEEILKRHPSLLLEDKPTVLTEQQALHDLFIKTELRDYDQAHADGIRKAFNLDDGLAFSRRKDEHERWKKQARSAFPGLGIVIDDISPKIRDFVGGRGGQKVLGNRLLACDIISAYVISGEIIPQSSLEPTVHVCSGGEITLKQIEVPEIIIDGMATEQPYYQKLDAPVSLIDSGFDSRMPAVTTYLVANTSAA